MKTMPSLFVRCATLAVLGLAASSAAHAQNANVTFSLTPNMISTTAGSTVTFFGSVVNQAGAPTVFLNGDTSPQVDPVLTVDDRTSDFFNATPIMLMGGQSFPSSGTASFFTVMVASNAAPGTYSGTFNIQGGADSNAQDAVASQTFSVVVAAAPEPSQIASLAVGMLGLAALGLKARKRTAPAQA